MNLEKLLDIEQKYSFVNFRRYHKENGSVFMMIVEGYGIRTDMSYVYNQDLRKKENAINAVRILHEKTLGEEIVVIHASYNEKRNGYNVAFVEKWSLK